MEWGINEDIYNCPKCGRKDKLKYTNENRRFNSSLRCVRCKFQFYILKDHERYRQRDNEYWNLDRTKEWVKKSEPFRNLIETVMDFARKEMSPKENKEMKGAKKLLADCNQLLEDSDKPPEELIKKLESAKKDAKESIEVHEHIEGSRKEMDGLFDKMLERPDIIDPKTGIPLEKIVMQSTTYAEEVARWLHELLMQIRYSAHPEIKPQVRKE